MNGFLLAILLPLLLLSVTPDVSAVKCYLQGRWSEYEGECKGNDVVCFSVVKKDSERTALYKGCGERNEAINYCQQRARLYQKIKNDGICKEPYATDLCNNEFFEYPDHH